MVAEPSVINIPRDFTETPGPRTRREGAFSAEQFRDEILLPRFDAAMQSGGILLVDLDGGFGYGTSFLEETFGGLARLRGPGTVLRHLVVKSDEEPYLKDDIVHFIRKVRQ